MTPVIVVGVVIFILVVAWSVVFSQKLKQKRVAAGEQLADSLGATFSAEYHAPPDLGLDAFESMTLGTYPQMRNLIRGDVEGIGFDIFDFSARIRLKIKHQSGYRELFLNHTVVALRIPDLALGRFRVHHKNVQDVARAMAESQDIEVPSDLEFDRQFIVRGDQPDSVRQILNEEVRAAIQQHPKRFVEVDGDQVLVYQQQKSEPIENWLSLRDSALQVGLELMKAA